MKYIPAECNVPIALGRLGENIAKSVVFDIEADKREYPNATFALLHRRANDPAAYPVPPDCITFEENKMIWLIKSGDLAFRGNGLCEYIVYEGEAVLKSVIYTTYVDEALDGSGNPPDPWETWVQQVLAAARTVEQAVAHMPTIVDGNWYMWNSETGEYEDSGVQAEGHDGYSPTVTVEVIEGGHRITITDASGPHTFDVMDGTAEDFIDDTAGEGDTDKTWSANKLAEETTGLLNAIQGKQDAPSTAGTSGQVLGLVTESNEVVPKWVDQPSVPSAASSAQIKGGADSTHFLSPSKQEESLFYALSKLAGVDLASGSDTVRVYSDASKVAIQKMLGIYEAPWELIRTDTVTNATEADVEITVDGNGASFELTDVYLQVWTPQQETNASIGDYGRVNSYYGDSNIIASQMGTWTQSANASAKYGQVLLTNENGAIRNETTQNATQYSLVNLTSRTNIIADDALLKIGTYSFSKITIKKVTGTMKYKLYGKRKWN